MAEGQRKQQCLVQQLAHKGRGDLVVPHEPVPQLLRPNHEVSVGAHMWLPTLHYLRRANPRSVRHQPLHKQVARHRLLAGSCKPEGQRPTVPHQVLARRLARHLAKAPNEVAPVRVEHRLCELNIGLARLLSSEPEIARLPALPPVCQGLHGPPALRHRRVQFTCAVGRAQQRQQRGHPLVTRPERIQQRVCSVDGVGVQTITGTESDRQGLRSAPNPPSWSTTIQASDN